jgi:hypothetical protein
MPPSSAPSDLDATKRSRPHRLDDLDDKLGEHREHLPGVLCLGRCLGHRRYRSAIRQNYSRAHAPPFPRAPGRGTARRPASLAVMLSHRPSRLDWRTLSRPHPRNGLPGLVEQRVVPLPGARRRQQGHGAVEPGLLLVGRGGIYAAVVYDPSVLSRRGRAEPQPRRLHRARPC